MDLTASFTGNSQTIVANGVATSGISYHLLADENVWGAWFGLPEARAVVEPRTANAGSVIVSNYANGKVLDVVLFAVCNNATAAWNALTKMNQVFDLTEGVQGSVSVTFDGQTRGLNDCERRGASRATIDTQWDDANPTSIVWRYEVELVSQNPQWS